MAEKLYQKVKCGDTFYKVRTSPGDYYKTGTVMIIKSDIEGPHSNFDWCRSPIGHIGNPCIFCGFDDPAFIRQEDKK